MAAIFNPMSSPRTLHALRLIARTSPISLRRTLSTLPQNSNVVRYNPSRSPLCNTNSIQYVHEQNTGGKKNYIYSYLSQTPPIASLAIASSHQHPPTPESLTENHEFMEILHWVIKDHAFEDPDVKAQAAMYASQAGSGLGSGGVFFSQQRQQRRRKQAGGDGAGGASAQGGMGGAGRGGYIHVSDQRNPPDFGRVAWPEDIFGSLELDGEGQFVDGTGRYQKSGTYRVMTNEGFLGLSPYLREKVVERLEELDGQARKNG
jgi:hypothetical protein